MNSSIIRKCLTSSVIVSLFLAAVSIPLGGCTPSDAKLEKAISAVLEKNPKILQEAIKKAGPQRPQPQPELPLADRIKNAIPIDLNNAPVKGSVNAPITIVEFSDFECPFCSRVVPTMNQLLKDYDGKVRFAFRQNPLPFHKNAMPAAKASLAANEQGKFWEMHDALFENQKNLTEENLLKVAQKIGLNMSKFKADFKSTKFDKQIQDDIAFAQKTGASGTPAFFINGVALKGARPVDSFKEVIDKLLELKGAAPAPAAAPKAAEPQPKQ